jgi:hypothetical protein
VRALAAAAATRFCGPAKSRAAVDAVTQAQHVAEELAEIARSQTCRIGPGGLGLNLMRGKMAAMMPKDDDEEEEVTSCSVVKL